MLDSSRAACAQAAVGLRLDVPAGAAVSRLLHRNCREFNFGSFGVRQHELIAAPCDPNTPINKLACRPTDANLIFLIQAPIPRILEGAAPAPVHRRSGEFPGICRAGFQNSEVPCLPACHSLDLGATESLQRRTN